MAGTTTHRLDVEVAGGRLDKFVAEECPELSRTQAQRLIEDGEVTVNGEIAKPGLKLAVGDRIEVRVPPVTASTLEPEAIPFGVLYEDDDVLVIDKPAGLAVHPAPGHPDHTLANAILAYLPESPDTGDALRPGIVHRLDKDTSGVMLVAKNRLAHADLSRQFKSREVSKVYLALVRGRLSPEKGSIEAAIGRDPRNRKRMAVVDDDRGRDARTRYRVIQYLGNRSLLEITPGTGRTHQIRVHLAAIGHPVVGDATYGPKPAVLPRQFLHAKYLSFHLPASGRYVEFESELPADLAQVLASLV